MVKSIKNILLALIFVLCCFGTVMAQPVQPAADMQALLGFYRGEGSNIIIRERDGFLELLYGVTADDYAFNQSNVYQMRKLRHDSYELIVANPRDYRGVLDLKFERDNQGRGITCIVDKQRYSRIFFAGEDNNDFTVELVQNIQAYRTNALEAVMPKQAETMPEAKLVNVGTVNPGIKIDMVYAGKNNFISTQLYESKNAYLQEEATAALGRVNQRLAAYGYGILVWDAYRPWYITKMLHEILPDGQKSLLEAPEQGSSHNRGLSVDVTLYHLATGQQVKMISGFDELSLRANSKFQGGSALERFRRNLLRQLMFNEGFTGVDHEWWHFDYQNFDKYKLLNTAFSQLDKA